MQLRFVSALQSFKTQPVHADKPQDMGEKRSFRIEPSSLHHHTYAINRQLFEPPPLLRLHLSCKPYEVFVLTKFLF